LLETIDVHSTCNMDVASIVLDCSIVAQYKAEHCFYNPGESRTQIQRFLHVEREVRITCSLLDFGSCVINQRIVPFAVGGLRSPFAVYGHRLRF